MIAKTDLTDEGSEWSVNNDWNGWYMPSLLWLTSFLAPIKRLINSHKDALHSSTQTCSNRLEHRARLTMDRRAMA